MIRDLEDEVYYIVRVSDCVKNLNSSQRVPLMFTNSLIRLKLRNSMVP